MLSDINNNSAPARATAIVTGEPTITDDDTFNISLDIETLSTHKHAVVLSIGAVLFNQFGVFPSVFRVGFHFQDQIDAGRHISYDTLNFWALQDQHVFQDAVGGEYTLLQGMRQFTNWINSVDPENTVHVWTKGPAFDGAIIEDLCESTLGGTCPITYRQWRDVRTIESLANYVPPKIIDGAHDPVVDAIAQAKSVIECRKILKGSAA